MAMAEAQRAAFMKVVVCLRTSKRMLFAAEPRFTVAPTLATVGVQTTQFTHRNLAFGLRRRTEPALELAQLGER